MVRIKEERRSGRLVGAAETSKELAEWRRLERKNSNIVRQSRLCKQEKEQSCLSRSPDREGERGKVGERDQSGSMERRGWTPQRRNAGEGEGGQAKTASIGEVEGSTSG